MKKDKTFWKDDVHGQVHGGYYFRAFDLVKFIKKVENKEGEIVGLEFDGNNVNVIIKRYEQRRIKKNVSTNGLQ